MSAGVKTAGINRYFGCWHIHFNFKRPFSSANIYWRLLLDIQGGLVTYKYETIIKMHLYDSLVHVSIYSDIIGIHVEYTSV